MIKQAVKKLLPGDTQQLEQRCRQLEERVKALEKENKQQQARIDQLISDLSHRREAPLRDAALTRASQDKQVWTIKCPAPDTEKRTRWGDYHFALSLKKNLEEQGVFVSLDFREDWDYETYSDVVLVLRGNRFYRPQRWRYAGLAKAPLYIMWNISHPEDVSDAEYELYDVVCVASNHYTKLLQKRLRVPVYPLLQCTDTDVFCPERKADEYADTNTDAGRQYDLVFVGNAKEIYRESVMWAVEDGRDVAIWGGGWKPFLQDKNGLVRAQSIENDQIPGIYRSAKAVLNDHWEDMRRCQFINNRIFDALACGTPVVSDTFPELKELFPESVLQYSTKEEYTDCVRQVLEKGAQLRSAAASEWDRIEKDYSFKTRARQLMDVAAFALHREL